MLVTGGAPIDPSGVIEISAATTRREIVLETGALAREVQAVKAIFDKTKFDGLDGHAVSLQFDSLIIEPSGKRRSYPCGARQHLSGTEPSPDGWSVQ